MRTSWWLDRLLALLLVELLLAFLVFLVPDLIELTAPDLLAIILVTLVGINRLKVRIGIPPLEDLGNLDHVESVDFFLLLTEIRLILEEEVHPLLLAQSFESRLALLHLAQAVHVPHVLVNAVNSVVHLRFRGASFQEFSIEMIDGRLTVTVSIWKFDSWEHRYC